MYAEPEDKTKFLLERYDHLKTDRASQWDSYFQELKDYVNPDARDFNRIVRDGNRRRDIIFENTAGWALEQFAAGMQTYLIPSSQQWFLYALLENLVTDDEDVLAHMEIVTDRALAYYGLAESNFEQSFFEGFLDVGVFGTEVILQEWNSATMCPLFRAYPLSQCYILENEMGMIDTLFRRVDLTTRQVKQRFEKDKIPSKILECKNSEQKWQIVHAVYPRNESEVNQNGGSANMAFASVWFCVDYKAILAEGGYLEMPYAVARWKKVAGENYGRSPAMTALADIKMVNEIAKVDIKSRQLAMAPPMQVPNDGFIADLDMTPYAVNYREPGTDKAEPLITGARPDVADSTIKMKQEAIGRAFYTDLMQLRWKNERQTATEITERRDDMLRMMSPMISRLTKELLGPTIKRTYNLMLRNNVLPPHPPQISKKRMSITYLSPAAIAQRGSKINAMKEYLTQDLIPLAQIDPSVLDVVSTDLIAQESAILRNVTRKIFRTADQVAAIRQQKAQQQQMASVMQNAQQAASALKDVGSAGKSTPQLLGLPAQ